MNRLLGLTENMIGGSQVNWIHQHVVQHHLHTNDVHLDPDMQVYFFNKNDVRYLQSPNIINKYYQIWHYI